MQQPFKTILWKDLPGMAWFFPQLLLQPQQSHPPSCSVFLGQWLSFQGFWMCSSLFLDCNTNCPRVTWATTAQHTFPQGYLSCLPLEHPVLLCCGFCHSYVSATVMCFFFGGGIVWLIPVYIPSLYMLWRQGPCVFLLITGSQHLAQCLAHFGRMECRMKGTGTDGIFTLHVRKIKWFA